MITIRVLNHNFYSFGEKCVFPQNYVWAYVKMSHVPRCDDLVSLYTTLEGKKFSLLGRVKEVLHQIDIDGVGNFAEIEIVAISLRELK